MKLSIKRAILMASILVLCLAVYQFKNDMKTLNESFKVNSMVSYGPGATEGVNHFGDRALLEASMVDGKMDLSKVEAGYGLEAGTLSESHDFYFETPKGIIFSYTDPKSFIVHFDTLADDTSDIRFQILDDQLNVVYEQKGNHLSIREKTTIPAGLHFLVIQTKGDGRISYAYKLQQALFE